MYTLSAIYKYNASNGCIFIAFIDIFGSIFGAFFCRVIFSKRQHGEHIFWGQTCLNFIFQTHFCFYHKKCSKFP